MAEVASAYVSLLPSARGFGKNLEKEVGRDTKKTGGRLGTSFGKAFTLAGGALAAVGIGSFLKGAISESSDAQQSIGATASIFKEHAETVISSSKDAAQQYGLSANEYRESANLIGSLFKNQGVELDELAGKTDTMIGRASDLAAMFGGTTADAVESLSSAFKGEFNPLEKYGITLNQTAINAELAARGQEDLEGAALATAKQAATTDLILRQSSDSMGTFADESSTYAGQMQRLSAQWDDMKAALGRRLLPVLTTVAEYINDTALPAVSDFAGKARDLVQVAWGKLETGVSALSKMADVDFESIKDFATTSWGKLEGGIDALRKLQDIDFSKIDGGKLGTQLADAIDGALVSIGGSSGKLTKTMGDLFGKIDWAKVGLLVGRELPAMFLTLAAGMLSGEAVDKLINTIQEHWKVVLLGAATIAFAPAKMLAPLTKILGKIPFVGAFLAGSVTWLNKLGGRLLGFGRSLFTMFWRGFSRSPIPGAGLVVRIVASLKTLPGRMRSFLSTLQTRIGVWALDAFEAMGKGARGAIGGLLKWLAGVPGMIFRAIGSLARTLSPRGAEAVSGFLRGAQGKWSAVGGWLGSLAGRVLSAVGNLAGVLVGVGRNMMLGLMGGIRSMASSVWGAARDVVMGAINSAKSALRMRSPSRVFFDIGSLSMEGYVNGVLGRKKKVAASVSDVLGTFASTANPLIRQAEKWGDKIAEAIGTKGIGKGLKKRLKGLGAEVKGLGKSLAQQLEEGMRLKELFEGVRDSVASAFKSDWFSSAASEAEKDDAGNIIKPAATAVENFLKSLSGDKGIAESVSAAFAKLKTIPGLSKDFLTSLFQSGNSDLILALAGGPTSNVLDADRMFGEVNTLTSELGKQVGANQYGEGIYAVRDEIRQLRKDVRQIGPEVAKGVNSAAAAGQRAKKAQAAKKKAGAK